MSFRCVCRSVSQESSQSYCGLLCLLLWYRGDPSCLSQWAAVTPYTSAVVVVLMRYFPSLTLPPTGPFVYDRVCVCVCVGACGTCIWCGPFTFSENNLNQMYPHKAASRSQRDRRESARRDLQYHFVFLRSDTFSKALHGQVPVIKAAKTLNRAVF